MTMTAQAAAQSALFIEESRQLLLQIEQGWQQAKPNDVQWREQMLRQLHQLKGLALSFNEDAAADCCHQLENQLNQKDIALSAIQAVAVSQALGRLHEIVHSLNYVAKPLTDKTVEQTAAVEQLWQIDFKPLPGFFENGQDPLQYLKQLQQLGEITVQADSSKLPEFADFDASQLYLNWQIQLKTAADEQTLRQVFDWVKEVCELKITAIRQSPSITNQAKPVQHTAPQSHASFRQILNRLQQQTAWLAELQHAADLLPLSLQTRLAQLQLAQSQNYLALQKLNLKPLTSAFQRLPALLQTICKQTGKQVELKLPQQTVWLPASVLDFINDVLIQLLRNALAHGIESPDARLTNGKASLGQIVIEQSLQGMQLKLKFQDDGAGLQAEKIFAAAGGNVNVGINELIFQAGLSTANTPDLLSGRGIGLDLVRQHIQHLQGDISVESIQGQGCAFHINIPLQQTLQVLHTAVIADQLYVLPLDSIVDDFAATELSKRYVSGRGEFVEYKQQWLPVWDIRQRFKLAGSSSEQTRVLIISERERLCVLKVEKLLPPAEYLLTKVNGYYQPMPGVLALATNGQTQPALCLQWHAIFGDRK